MDRQYLKQAVASSPAFLVDKQSIIATLKELAFIRQHSGCKIQYSIKALPFSFVLDWIKPRVDGFAVSSLFEARLAKSIQAGSGSLHLTTPGLIADEMAELGDLCDYISFNSASQFKRLSTISDGYAPGIRVNPRLSFLNDNRYDPCRRFSKLGIDIATLEQFKSVNQVKGLHFHTVFSYNNIDPLVANINALKAVGGLNDIEWLNLGGGYIFNEVKEQQRFIDLIQELKREFQLEVFFEPGKAVVGNAGLLLATVIDLFESDGKTIAVLDTSVNHNPEVFEYQKQPQLSEAVDTGEYSAVLAGSTCLAGDVFGEYRFDHQLVLGERLLFEQVGAYSLVKSNRFNGHNFPDIYSFDCCTITPLKQYSYADYKKQWVID